MTTQRRVKTLLRGARVAASERDQDRFCLSLISVVHFWVVFDAEVIFKGVSDFNITSLREINFPMVEVPLKTVIDQCDLDPRRSQIDLSEQTGPGDKDYYKLKFCYTRLELKLRPAFRRSLCRFVGLNWKY